MPLILLTIVPFPWLNPVGPHSILKVPPKGLEPPTQSNKAVPAVEVLAERLDGAGQLAQASTPNTLFGIPPDPSSNIKTPFWSKTL